MNNKFKYTPLAIVVASALSIVGCGDSSGNTANTVAGNGNNNPVETKNDMARVKLAVKFPEADATAAWVGDSKSIEVSFFNTVSVGSIAEANKAFTDNQCKENSERKENNQYDNCVVDDDVLRGQFAASVSMDTSSPSSFVDLLPGKYRVEAKFYNADGKHQETSISYVTLSKGEHSLKLRGVEATWTAAQQLNLQLLNQSNDFDWDPKTEGNQTAAEVMGIKGAINGLHLPSVLTYPDGYLSGGDRNYNGQGHWQDILINAGVLNVDQLDRESQATAFQPVLRIADANNGEYNLLPHYLVSNEQQKDEEGSYTGSSGSWNTTELATLKQEYSSKGEKAYLDLGGYYLGYWHFDAGSNENNNDSVALDFGLASVDENAGPKYSIVHNNNYYGEGVTIAHINTNAMPDEHQSWQQLFVDLQAVPNKVVDGSTISGYLIESETHTTRVNGNQWNDSGTDVKPVSFLEAALFDIAEKEGLVAKGAAESNCRTQQLSGMEYSSDYRWDDEKQGWIAGTYNQFLAEGNLVSQIEQQIQAKTDERDRAQSEVDQYQADLAPLDAAIVAKLEAQKLEFTTAISELDAYLTENSEIITNYQAAVDEESSANEVAQATSNSYTKINDQVSLYNAGQLPECDAACYATLQQERDAAATEMNNAWQLLNEKQEKRRLLYISYKSVEQYMQDLQNTYNIWNNSDPLLVKAALQEKNDALQAQLDLIASNGNITNYSSNDGELYSNRQIAWQNFNNASMRLTSVSNELTQLEQLKVDALAAADLNGDGEAEIFEEGVYLASGDLSGLLNWDSSWDQTTGQQKQNITLQLNDFVIKDTVKASTLTGEQTICVQPFTLKASQLSMEFDTAADVVIE